MGQQTMPPSHSEVRGSEPASNLHTNRARAYPSGHADRPPPPAPRAHSPQRRLPAREGGGGRPAQRGPAPCARRGGTAGPPPPDRRGGDFQAPERGGPRVGSPPGAPPPRGGPRAPP